jgi:hypothetical protein
MFDGQFAIGGFERVVAKRVIAFLTCRGFNGQMRASREGGQGMAFRMHQAKEPNISCDHSLLLHLQREKIGLKGHEIALNV